ncbi:MAG: hypothetical protein MHMPM18_005003 [Marteilia pararefringens]
MPRSNGKKRQEFPEECLFTLMLCELLSKCELKLIEVIRQKLIVALDKRVQQGEEPGDLEPILTILEDTSVHPFQVLYNKFKGCVKLTRK